MTNTRIALLAVFLFGCAGVQRDCSSCNAGSFGADWIVVQYRFDGAPIHCWELLGTSMENEKNSDGIFWQDPDGHLVHISGWYNRVQVSRSRWAEAAATIGVDEKRCKGSTSYVPEPLVPVRPVFPIGSETMTEAGAP